MTQEGFSNLTVLNSHKERTAKFAHPHHPHFKRGGNWPPHFKNCSVGPAYTVYNCNLLLCLHKQTRNVYVVVDFFLYQLIFIFALSLGMIIYANEFETKEQQKLTEMKAGG